jgi:NAD(P)-dependent dehydrogenase (short-subunit alcohol dehydrogenase family)
MRLQHKIAVVTGSASGIGYATAQTLAREGATAIISDIDAEGARRAASEITRSGGHALAVATDVSDRSQVIAMVQAVIDQYERLDILVNNAAKGGPRKPFAESDVDDWRPDIDVGLMGTLYCCRAVIPHMQERQNGRIISMTSDAGKIGTPQRSLYSAAKAAVAGFSRAIARELALDGITVNCVSPGIVATERWLELERERPGFAQEFYDATPLARPARPAEIAATIAFLASDDAAYITGQNYSVNGGYYM